jgi:hypothetical protein
MSQSGGTGIAQWYSAGLRSGWSGVRAQIGSRNLFLYRRVQTGSGAHTASNIKHVPGSLSLEVKRLGLEADHSPPPRSYTSTPPIRLHGVVLSEKTQGQLYLYLYVWLSQDRSIVQHSRCIWFTMKLVRIIKMFLKNICCEVGICKYFSCYFLFRIECVKEIPCYYCFSTLILYYAIRNVQKIRRIGIQWDTEVSGLCWSC